MKLEQTLAKISARPKSSAPALMTHAVLGYPNMKESADVVRAMADSGASLIELQIPFSDPMADGPTIMAANEAALKSGATVNECFKIAEKLVREVSTPLIFMSYFNILFRHQGGVKGFCRHAAEIGIQAMIVPDVPPEEHKDAYWSEAAKCGVLPIPVVAPVSTPDRLKALKKVTRGGFVYCVSTTGTTGARKELPVDLGKYLQNVRKEFNLPLAVGFGISSPKQVRQLQGHAEIAIVGSAMIDAMTGGTAKERLGKVSKFTASLARG